MDQQRQANNQLEPQFCLLCDQFPPKYIMDLKSAAVYLRLWSQADKEGQKHLNKLKSLPAGEDGLVEYVLTIFPTQRFNKKLKESCDHIILYQCIEAETGLDRRASNFFSSRLLKEISKARHYLEVMFETTRQLSTSIPNLRVSENKEKRSPVETKIEPLKEEKTTEKPSQDPESRQQSTENGQYQYFMPVYPYQGAYNPMYCLFPTPQ